MNYHNIMTNVYIVGATPFINSAKYPVMTFHEKLITLFIDSFSKLIEFK